MVQPKNPPLAVRFRPEVLSRVDEYVVAAGTNRNAAIHDLIVKGLDAPVVQIVPEQPYETQVPAVRTLPTAVWAALDQYVAARDLPEAEALTRLAKWGLKQLMEDKLSEARRSVEGKGLPIQTGSEMKAVDTSSVPVAPGRYSEGRQDTGAGWGFNGRAKK